MMRPGSAVLAGLFLGLAALSPRAALAADSATTICRDEFGIPHIFAPTLNDAAFAVGYAQAEDRLEELLKNYRARTARCPKFSAPTTSRQTCDSASCGTPRSAGPITSRSPRKCAA